MWTNFLNFFYLTLNVSVHYLEKLENINMVPISAAPEIQSKTDLMFLRHRVNAKKHGKMKFQLYISVKENKYLQVCNVLSYPKILRMHGT